MEYAGRDVLKVRIFPIEPNSTKRITLAYTQVLKADSGMIDYVLPMSTGKYSAKPIKTVSVKVDLESKRPLKSIYSPTHSVEIRRDGPNRARIGYEANDVMPDTDFQLYFAPERDEIGLNLMTYKTGDQDGFFLLLAAPGTDVQPKQVAPKDVVFVLDTSGSMAGNKLNQAKKALSFCVENLNDNDRFELIRFSTEVEPLFNNFVDASPGNRAKAAEFIKDLKPIGATAIDEALRQALKLPANGDGRPSAVIFLTDGMPTIGTTDENQIVAGVSQRMRGNRRIFCFGIGTDVNTHLLDRIAEETHAFSEYVLPEEDIEVKVSSFFSKIKEPVLANPSLTFTADVRATKMYPSPLPDLFKGEQLILVGRYSGKGGSAAVIEGTLNGGQKNFTYDVNFPAESSEHDFIPRLWATRRVGYLLDQIRLHGENGELREEVTDLARKYGIVTPYTAYLIMEDESRRGLSSNLQSLPQLQGDSRARTDASTVANSFRLARDGEQAVRNSLSSKQLSQADVASSAIQNGVEQAQGGFSGGRGRGGRGGGGAGGGGGSVQSYNGRVPSAPPPAVTSPVERVAAYTQQTQFVGGRNFFQNGDQWIEAGVQKLPNARHVRVQFGSPEYFQLLTRHPEAAPWLALGQHVQFVVAGEVYEVFE